ncbi:MAG: ABC transporter permease subunit [Haloarculaceae archaeon]
MSLPHNRWLRVAVNDVREARRDRTLLALGVLYVLVGILGGYLLSQVSGFAEPGVSYAVLTLQLLGVLVPLTAVGITYGTVVGRRADGSMKLLLGLPYLRWDVVLGWYVGRLVVVTIVALVGFASIAVAGLVFGVALPEPVLVLQAVALVLAVGTALTGMALAISASTRSTTIAATATFLLAVALLFLWGVLGTALVFIVNGLSVGQEPAWATFLQAINPVNSFKALASMIVPTFDGLARLVSGETVYQTPAFAVVVLAVWSTVVPLLGYLRFRAVDI